METNGRQTSLIEREAPWRPQGHQPQELVRREVGEG